MKTLTVFTPTYNRAYTLQRTYESLCKQTSLDFEWLIVDDGSTDNTEELVEEWKNDANFLIKYFRKSNGGLHTGYNVAIQNIETELCMCCDSDDYLPSDAVETIVKIWKDKGSDNLAGIIGLDFIHGTDEPIGGYFSDTSKNCHFLDLTPKLGHVGDVKMVHRTALLKPHVPMPSLNGEKNFNPIYIFLKINPQLDYILLNKNLCFVEYQPTGMSANIFYQFRNSPRSFAELRKVRLVHPRIKFSRKIVDAAHLFSSSLIAKDLSILKDMPHKWMLAVSAPLGLAIYLLIRYKTKS